MRLLPLLAASIVTVAVAIAAGPYAPGAESGAAKPASAAFVAAGIRPAVADISAEASSPSTADAPAVAPTRIAMPPAPPPEPAPIGSAINIRPTGPPILLEVNKGTLIRLPRPAATVFVANPDIADVQVKSPSLIYVTAKASGETVIYAVDDRDNVLLSAPIRVDLDLSRLRESLQQAIPGERISAQSVEGRLVLSGKVSSAGRAEKAQALAVAIVGQGKTAQVVNDLAVESPNQVNLRVRIAEVERSVLKQLGINWQTMGNGAACPQLPLIPGVGLSATCINGSFNTQNPTTGLNNIIGTAVQNTISGSFRLPGSTARITATLDALAQEGLVTTLAEPNLTAMNGQTASFLVGGEFPVPTNVTTAVSGGVPTISVAYKPFGVRLEFTPTIIDDHHLNLKIRPEVSELSTTGAITISGIVIPALTVRRAETTVELGSGESFALAGLLEHNTLQDVSKVPGLGDIPVLGQLFRSNQFQRNESELVIIITPYLVNPVATASLSAPTDGFEPAHDFSQFLNNDTYREKLPGLTRSPVPAGGTGLIGPGGFRLD